MTGFQSAAVPPSPCTITIGWRAVGTTGTGAAGPSPPQARRAARGNSRILRTPRNEAEHMPLGARLDISTKLDISLAHDNRDPARHDPGGAVVSRAIRSHQARN